MDLIQKLKKRKKKEKNEMWLFKRGWDKANLATENLASFLTGRSCIMKVQAWRWNVAPAARGCLRYRSRRRFPRFFNLMCISLRHAHWHGLTSRSWRARPCCGQSSELVQFVKALKLPLHWVVCGVAANLSNLDFPSWQPAPRMCSWTTIAIHWWTSAHHFQMVFSDPVDSWDLYQVL